MRLITLLIVCCVLSGCAGNGYKDFYVPYKELDMDLATELRKNNNLRLEILQPNQEPQIIETNDLDREYEIYSAKHYYSVGYSSFNGEYEDKQNAIKQAKRIGATLVLIKLEYTNTQTSTFTIQEPTSETNSYSGSVYGAGGRVNYSGTNTTHGTTTSLMTAHQRRYDQSALYLVKASPITPYKFGLSCRNLSSEERAEAGRNTGVSVVTVFEDTPGFYANVLRGDIIISINGIHVKNKKHFDQLRDEAPGKSATLTILRKGVQKDIVVHAPNDK